jgi:hypothetical protein
LTNPHNPVSQRVREASLRVVHSIIELVAHLVVLAALLIGIWLLEKLVHWLWAAGHDYLFFASLKLRYVFNLADLAICLVS